MRLARSSQDTCTNRCWLKTNFRSNHLCACVCLSVTMEAARALNSLSVSSVIVATAYILNVFSSCLWLNIHQGPSGLHTECVWQLMSLTSDRTYTDDRATRRSANNIYGQRHCTSTYSIAKARSYCRAIHVYLHLVCYMLCEPSCGMWRGWECVAIARLPVKGQRGDRGSEQGRYRCRFVSHDTIYLTEWNVHGGP